MLAYLLGYRMSKTLHKDGTVHETYEEVCGSLYDAASVTWLLTQEGCPKYGIRPLGSYGDTAYLEFIRFLIEQNDYRKYLYWPG